MYLVAFVRLYVAKPTFNYAELSTLYSFQSHQSVRFERSGVGNPSPYKLDGNFNLGSGFKCKKTEESQGVEL